MQQEIGCLMFLGSSASRSRIWHIYDASQSNHEPSMSTETVKAGLSDLKEEKQSAPNKNARVLVAEDNKVNQQVILRMLRLEKVQGKYSATDFFTQS
jgi:hypothetical protein